MEIKRGGERPVERVKRVRSSPKGKKIEGKMKIELRFFNAFKKIEKKRKRETTSSLFSLSLERTMPPRIASQPSAGSAEVVASGDALRAVRLEPFTLLNQAAVVALALSLLPSLLNLLSLSPSSPSDQPKPKQAQRLLGYASLEDALAADRRRAEVGASRGGGLSSLPLSAGSEELQQARVPGLGLGASYLPHSVASLFGGGGGAVSGLSNLERRLGARIRGRGGEDSDGEGRGSKKHLRRHQHDFQSHRRAAAASYSDDEDEGGRAAAIGDRKAFVRAAPAAAAATVAVAAATPEGGAKKKKKKKKKKQAAENE